MPRAPSPALLARRGDAPIAADTAPALVAEASADVAPTRIVYRVRKGDTLFAIARNHGVTVDELRRGTTCAARRSASARACSIHTTRAAAAAQ